MKIIRKLLRFFAPFPSSRRPRALTIFPIIAFFIGILSWSLRGGKSSTVTALLEVTDN